MDICPSILEKTINDYFQTIKKLSKYFSWFQLDFADGMYVKNKTASLDDFLDQFISQQSIFNNLSFDFHLMTKNYQENIKKLFEFKNKIKIKNVFIHYDLMPEKNYFKNNKNDFIIGLAINPQNKIDSLAKKYNLKIIKAIQIMSVNPGAQGNPFIEKTLKKIEQLKNFSYRNKIFLDGGINDKTLPIILKQKFLPDVVCPGSFLAKIKNEDEIKRRIDFLKILKLKN
ncbi:MAG: hypothetical protein N2593_01780 [Patescibacteria group bacterium]|nr:hypothetical protein [Patescibacteria group bacterium]